MTDEYERYQRALLPFRDDGAGPDERIERLQGVIVDLLVEIEALRAVVAETPGLRERYAARYRETALLSHNGGGVTLGVEKVVLAFVDGDRQGGALREAPMLRRLGVDVPDYEREADFVSQLS